MRSKVRFLALLFGILMVSVGIAAPSWATMYSGLYYDYISITNVQSSQPNPYWVTPSFWGPSPYGINWGLPTPAPIHGLNGYDFFGFDIDVEDGTSLYFDTSTIPHSALGPQDGFLIKNDILPGTGIDSFDLTLLAESTDTSYTISPRVTEGFSIQFAPVHVIVNETPNALSLEFAEPLPSAAFDFDGHTYVAQLQIQGLDPQGNLVATQNGLTMWYMNVLVVAPEPSTMLLLGSGLIGLWGFRRKFFKK